MRFTTRKVRKVVIHTTDDQSLTGLLTHRSRAYYVLHAATIEKDEETSVRLDGDIRVPRGKVSFYQVVD